MKLVFFGTPEIALPCLRHIASSSHALALVVTQPDMQQGRSRKLEAPPVKMAAQTLGLPILQPETIKNNESFLNTLRELKPDACMVVSYGKIFSQKILDVPPLGFFNIHFSLLPKYRGASPVRTAILKGEEETGISFMKIVRRMDAGPVGNVLRTRIESDENTGDLEARLAKLSGPFCVDSLNMLEAGTLQFKEQAESDASFTRIFEKKDGIIDWNQSAEKLSRFVRAMTPWPGAQTFWQKKDTGEKIPLKLFSVSREESENPPENQRAGLVVTAGGNALVLLCGSGLCRVLELQAPGKKRMTAADFMRGNKIQAGDFFLAE